MKALQKLDYSSGHVPYRNDVGKTIDREAMARRIPGWGADADPSRRPGVPREKTSAPDPDAHWDIPDRQVPQIKVHHSIERPGITPVFGTSCPPSGISGLVRNFAYKFGEGRLLHWMPLILADRINVAEAIVVDLLKGRLPHPIQEMGLKAGVGEPSLLARRRRIRTLAIGAGVGLAVFGLATAISRSKTQAS